MEAGCELYVSTLKRVCRGMHYPRKGIATCRRRSRQPHMPLGPACVSVAALQLPPSAHPDHLTPPAPIQGPRLITLPTLSAP